MIDFMTRRLLRERDELFDLLVEKNVEIAKLHAEVVILERVTQSLRRQRDSAEAQRAKTSLQEAR